MQVFTCKGQGCIWSLAFSHHYNSWPEGNHKMHLQPTDSNSVMRWNWVVFDAHRASWNKDRSFLIKRVFHVGLLVLPRSSLVSSTLRILSPRWQTAPSTLSLQISASPHPVQSNPKVGHVLWPCWVIFFQKFKRGYLSLRLPPNCLYVCACAQVWLCVKA